MEPFASSDAHHEVVKSVFDDFSRAGPTGLVCMRYACGPLALSTACSRSTSACQADCCIARQACSCCLAHSVTVGALL